MTEANIEQKVTEQELEWTRPVGETFDNHIESVHYYTFPDTTVTVCCLKLRNGDVVVGDSTTTSQDIFDEDVGKEVAYNEAKKKMSKL